MTDLIDGLGGPAGFGENLGPTEDDGYVRRIDVTSVFENGIVLAGQRYSRISIGENGFVLLDSEEVTGPDTGVRPSDPAAFYLFRADHYVDGRDMPRPDPARATPGGTSTGSGAIWYDIDPAGGTITVTWDDVGDFRFDLDDPTRDRNAYQLRLTDLSNAPGAGPGAFALDYRYETVTWADTAFLDGGVGFSLGDGRNAFELPASGDLAALRALPDAGVISFTFDGDSITSNLPNAPVIPVLDPPIEGTGGNDRIVGTDGADIIRDSAGRDTIDPGLGADTIEISAGANTVRGTVAEHLGDEIVGLFRNDRLLFEGAAFGAGDVVFVDDFADSALVFDIDGDGAEDGRIATGIQTFISIFGKSALTATTQAGTYVTLVDDLPSPERIIAPDRYDGDQNTRAYLRGDGRADFVLRLSAASTTEEAGTALGVYTYDRDGVISDARLLTTDVVAARDAAFLLDDVDRGESIGVFVLRPDEAGALDAVDSFAFVDETGGAAGFDDRSFVFAEVNGEVISADIVHSARDSLNVDQQQHALIGMSNLPGLTIAMEDRFGGRFDFDDVVLSIERLALDLA